MPRSISQPAARTRWHISFNAPVVLGFSALCVAATVLGQITGDATTRALFMTYRSSLLDPFTYLRFFTHVLGHGGWDHLAGNLSYILLLGPLLEEKHGSRTLLSVILVTAAITGILNYVLFPNVALLGASGVVFAFILLSSVTSFRTGEIPLTFVLVAVIFLGQQVIQGVVAADNISNLSHFAGGIVGGAAGFRLGGKDRESSADVHKEGHGF